MKLYNSPDLNNLPIKNPLCYTEDEINELFDLSEEEAVELTKVINDSHVAINKVYSNSKTEERLAEILIEANQFATEQLGKSNFLSIDIVTSVNEVLDDTVIYLIDDGTSTNTYNQYVLINGVVTSLGSTQCDLTNYVTNDQLETKLEDYAKKNEVLSASDIVTTIDDTVTNAQVPSALATYNKINEINQFVVQEITITGTDLNDYTTTGIYMFNSGYCPTNIPVGVNGWLIVMPGGSAIKQLWFRYGTANANSYETYERIYTVSQGWGEWTIYGTSKNSQIFKGYLKDGTDINNILDNGVYNIGTNETIANLPNGAVNGWLIVYKGSASSSKQIFYRLGTTNRNDFETYVRTGNGDGSIWSDWSMQCATKIFNKSRTELTLTDSTNFTLHVSNDVKLNNSYSIKNGICQVNIDIDCLVASSISNIFNESLPKPYSGKYMANILPLYLNSTSADASYRPITLIVAGGTSNVIYGGTVGGRYFGSFSYPVADDWQP